jgi:hypothetical protein
MDERNRRAAGTKVTADVFIVNRRSAGEQVSLTFVRDVLQLLKGFTLPLRLK